MSLYTKLIAEACERNFNSIVDFSTWYDSYKNPFFIAEIKEVYFTDDATAIPIFRWRNFQVELYVVHDLAKVKEHSHPYVQVIQKLYYTDVNEWSSFTPVLNYPASHGNFPVVDGASLLLTYEKWHPKLTVTTLAATWKGKTAGPVQETLIKKIYPNAKVSNGYADISVGLSI